MWIPATGRVTILISSLQSVPVNLSQGSGIRTQRRCHVFRQRTGRQRIQLFKYPRAAPVKFHIFIKNNVDAGQAENRVTANGFYTRYSQQRSGQRVGYLVLDILRRTAGPVGVNNLLVFANIGNGIHRNRVRWQDPCVPPKWGIDNPPTNKNG